MDWVGSGLRYKKLHKNYKKIYKNYIEELLSVLWFPNITSAVCPNIHCSTGFLTCFTYSKNEFFNVSFSRIVRYYAQKICASYKNLCIPQIVLLKSSWISNFASGNLTSRLIYRNTFYKQISEKKRIKLPP